MPQRDITKAQYEKLIDELDDRKGPITTGSHETYSGEHRLYGHVVIFKIRAERPENEHHFMDSDSEASFL